jgi:hypothetical protein
MDREDVVSAVGAMTSPARLVADTLTVFVATTLVNPTNAREHWSARSKRAGRQREAVALAVWAALRTPRDHRIVSHITAKPTTPKAITLVGYVARKFDDDGLQAAMKSVRDGLQDCRLIHSDGPDSGHVFEYAQVVDKTRRGVEITVRLR